MKASLHDETCFIRILFVTLLKNYRHISKAL